jgi:hypothetical protein
MAGWPSSAGWQTGQLWLAYALKAAVGIGAYGGGYAANNVMQSGLSGGWPGSIQPVAGEESAWR